MEFIVVAFVSLSALLGNYKVFCDDRRPGECPPADILRTKNKISLDVKDQIERYVL